MSDNTPWHTGNEEARAARPSFELKNIRLKKPDVQYCTRLNQYIEVAATSHGRFLFIAIAFFVLISINVSEFKASATCTFSCSSRLLATRNWKMARSSRVFICFGMFYSLLCTQFSAEAESRAAEASVVAEPHIPFFLVFCFCGGDFCAPKAESSVCFASCEFETGELSGVRKITFAKTMMRSGQCHQQSPKPRAHLLHQTLTLFSMS